MYQAEFRERLYQVPNSNFMSMIIIIGTKFKQSDKFGVTTILHFVYIYSILHGYIMYMQNYTHENVIDNLEKNANYVLPLYPSILIVELQTLMLAGIILVTSVLCVNGRIIQSMTGKLEITVVKAYNLPDSDSGSDRSDPKAKVRAYNTGGGYFTRTTKRIENNLNPNWDQTFDDFPHGNWDRFTIEVWDADDAWQGGDDKITETFTVPITTPCDQNIVVGDRKGTNIVCSYLINYS